MLTQVLLLLLSETRSNSSSIRVTLLPIPLCRVERRTPSKRQFGLDVERSQSLKPPGAEASLILPTRVCFSYVPVLGVQCVQEALGIHTVNRGDHGIRHLTRRLLEADLSSSVSGRNKCAVECLLIISSPEEISNHGLDGRRRNSLHAPGLVKPQCGTSNGTRWHGRKLLFSELRFFKNASSGRQCEPCIGCTTTVIGIIHKSPLPSLC